MSVILLLTTLIMSISSAFTVYAENNSKRVVRVGWHETPFFIKDDNGRMSGYSYEYQCKIAAYTGWDYVNMSMVHGRSLCKSSKTEK